MTNGEALELIKKNDYFNEDSLKKHKELRDYKEANDLSIIALGKQIPKPVVRNVGCDCYPITRNIESCYCPACGYHIDINLEEQYCPLCGQAIDWEGEDDES